MSERPAGGHPVSAPVRLEAAERLGRLLYYHLERLDPSYEERPWDDLPGSEQDVYIDAIWNVITFGGKDVLLLLPDHSDVSRST